MSSEKMMGGRRFESQTPHFFKIILFDALQNERLGIPKKFVVKYGRNLSESVRLQVASGDAWEVQLVRGDGGIWLRRGWPDFVKHYAIEHGHFLVFRYEGASAFRVFIFDKSATEIEYPVTSKVPKREENEGDVSGEDLSDQSHWNQRQELPSSTRLSPSSKKKGKKTNERLNKQAVRGGGSNIFCDANAGLKSGYWRRNRLFRGHESSEALKRAASFQSPNPFFLSFVEPSHFHSDMKPPAKFFMEYIPSYSSGGDVHLYISSERFWSVGYRFSICSQYRQVNFSRGWKRFLRDNYLKVGDVCVFELTSKVDQVSFRVLIFRANQDAIEQEEASQHKLKTNSSKPDKSEYGQAKSEEASSHEQSAATQKYRLPEAHVNGDRECTGGTVSPSGITPIETASKFCTNRPSFRIVIHLNISRRSTQDVPTAFVRRFSEHGHIRGTLRVGRRTWPIKLWVYSQRKNFKGKFTTGWSNFARDNALQAGDVCKFELLILDLMVLKVSIFRKASTKLGR